MIDFNEITEQKITEKYESLPQDLKDVLSSINTSIAIENITTKYQLDGNRITMLIQLVGLVILGFASFDNMKEEMKETIRIDPPTILLIADEIRQKIFLPIINSLQKISNVPTKEDIASKAPAPIAAPQPAKLVPDRYREAPISSESEPEIINLRKPPAPISVPAPKPTVPPITLKVPAPTQTLPPLIEADPHKIIPRPQPIAPAPIQVPAPQPERLQFIMRPPGLPPSDLPTDILDLRKEK